ncbi:MAG: hypothetical protein WC998_01885 [Candidatus Paceibacterota bacterium]|jgi:hypothetical protein
MSAKLKAYFFTVLFSVIGSIMIWKNFNLAAVPLILFYVILIINSFFSIEFFSKITPDNNEQKVIDLSMVAIYLILILNLGNEFRYLLSSAVLFVVATLKYVLLLGTVDIKILKRKIIIDLFGGIACILALVGSLAGYGEVTNWIWALVFLFANVYLLVIKPMYRL